MTQLMKYPSTDQFRQVIRNVKTRSTYVGKDEEGNAIYDNTRTVPTLKFQGTVKLHGSNGGVVLNVPSHDPSTWNFQYQSRERILTLDQDNSAFMLNMSTHEDIFARFFEEILETSPVQTVYQVGIFGEWVGQGIQKGVAVSELPKMFVIFGIRVKYRESDEEKSLWLDLNEWKHLESPEHRIFNILNFQTYEIEIDFNYPELAQAKLIEITDAVEKECPVGKAFLNELNGLVVTSENVDTIQVGDSVKSELKRLVKEHESITLNLQLSK